MRTQIRMQRGLFPSFFVKIQDQSDVTSHTTFDPGGSAGYHKDNSAPGKDSNDGINADTAAPKFGESNISFTNLGANKRSGTTPARGGEAPRNCQQ